MMDLTEIVELERRRARAWIERDREALAALLHEDYVEINVFGRFSKAQVLDELFPNHELLTYEMSEHRLLGLGDSACVLNYRVNETLRSADRIATYECFVSADYQRTSETWLLRLWQITPLTVSA